MSWDLEVKKNIVACFCIPTILKCPAWHCRKRFGFCCSSKAKIGPIWYIWYLKPLCHVSCVMCHVSEETPMMWDWICFLFVYLHCIMWLHITVARCLSPLTIGTHISLEQSVWADLSWKPFRKRIASIFVGPNHSGIFFKWKFGFLWKLFSISFLEFGFLDLHGE